MTRLWACALVAVTVGCKGSDAGDRAPAKTTAAAPAAIEWHTDEAAAFAAAREAGRGVMIDIKSTWCAPCEQLDRQTFTDHDVIDFVHRHYVALKLDVTEATEADEATQARWKAPLLPAVIFAGPDGAERGRVGEFLPPTEFLAVARATVQ